MRPLGQSAAAKPALIHAGGYAIRVCALGGRPDRRVEVRPDSPAGTEKSIIRNLYNIRSSAYVWPVFESRHLRVFAVVVREGSYSAAAKSLGYTQPAISQQMKALERAIGTPLFARVGRGLRLTDAGEVLSGHADGILGSMAAAQEQMRAITRLHSGRIRICAFPSASATVVAAAVASISAEHPGMRIELLEAEPSDSLTALSRGECDIALAFRYGTGPEQLDAELVEIPLLNDPLVVLMPTTHPLARRRSVELPELAGERWIAGCERCRGHFVEACSLAGFTPDIAFSAEDHLVVQSLVAAGAGVALMPRLVLSFMCHPKVAGRSLTPTDHRRVAAYTLPGHLKAPATRLALKALQQAAAELAADSGQPTRGQAHT